MLVTQRKPIVPLTPESREELRNRPGSYVMFRRLPGRNAYEGYVEHSFSMGWDVDHVSLFWTGTGTDQLLGLTMTIDGNETVQRHLAKARQNYPDAEIVVYDAHDPEMPFTLDWEAYLDAQAYDPNTLSGVTNKFRARNIPFAMKDPT